MLTGDGESSPWALPTEQLLRDTALGPCFLSEGLPGDPPSGSGQCRREWEKT